MKREKTAFYVSIDPYNQKSYLFDRTKRILRSFQPKFVKKNFYISYINSRDFIFTQVQISKNIPPEDLKDVIELQVYEELDLDQTVEYKIEYFEFFSIPSDRNRYFHVFVTERTIIEETFKEIRRSIPYIDQIVPSPLLFKTLYTNSILDMESVDLFIYFQRHDAFLSIYQEGDLIYTKSLKYSFKDIAERLSAELGQDISVDEVLQDLSKEGLKVSDLKKFNGYMKIFGELFVHISDILIYAKRANNIELIDNIYISSEIGFIHGIEEYCQTYLTGKVYDFSFDYGIQTNEHFVEDLHFLMVLTAQDILERYMEYPNFTLFPRPAPFFKRPSGELVLVLLAGILIGAAYPAYNFFMGYKYRYEAALLQAQYPSIHAKRISLEKKVNALKKELQQIKEKVLEKEKELKRSENILNAIYAKKVHYVMKGATIAELSQDLVNHKILVTLIENNDSTMEFNVTATDDKSITKFIKYITDNKFDRFDIATEEINKTKTETNATLYFSRIEVRIK
ncbi:MAG: hypothetical protein GXO19_02185 [Epsilonproteobacteria bacterium]|nr:hypothetical protein [Campylobacterota bacterium]NPA56526.1 hypothetical protein [Campylobacterota bacterium]